MAFLGFLFPCRVGRYAISYLDADGKGSAGGDEAFSLAVGRDDGRQDTAERKAVPCVGEHEERTPVRGRVPDGGEGIVHIDTDGEVGFRAAGCVKVHVVAEFGGESVPDLKAGVSLLLRLCE